MALTWSSQSKQAKEKRQQKLLKVQAKIVHEKEAVEQEIGLLEEEVKGERALAVEARKQETVAKTQVERTKNRGLPPVPKYAEMYTKAQMAATSANMREAAALKLLRAVKAKLPIVPSVPTLDKISLGKSEIISVALYVLLDVLKLNKWITLAIMVVGGALFYFAEKQGWIDFINF